MISQSARERLIGTWTLVSTEQVLRNGTTRPFPELGPEGKGYLVYTADGHMCGALMNPHRVLWKDPDHPTEAEQVDAIEGFVAYCGRYEVDEANKIIYHYPEIAWKPNFVGSKQKRPYSLEGDMLVLSDDVRDDPEIHRWRITWRKVK